MIGSLGIFLALVGVWLLIPGGRGALDPSRILTILPGIAIESILTPSLVDQLGDDLAGDFEVTHDGTLLLHTRTAVTAIRSEPAGTIEATQILETEDLQAIALDASGALLGLAGDTLVQFKEGTFEPLLVLPSEIAHPRLSGSSSHALVYIYGGDPKSALETKIVGVGASGLVSHIAQLHAPVTAVADHGNGVLYFATAANEIFSYQDKVLRLIISLPNSVGAIQSLAAPDGDEAPLIFSTSDHIYALRGLVAVSIAKGVGGTLRWRNDRLYVWDVGRHVLLMLRSSSPPTGGEDFAGAWLLKIDPIPPPGAAFDSGDDASLRRFWSIPLVSLGLFLVFISARRRTTLPIHSASLQRREVEGTSSSAKTLHDELVSVGPRPTKDARGGAKIIGNSDAHGQGEGALDPTKDGQTGRRLGAKVLIALVLSVLLGYGLIRQSSQIGSDEIPQPSLTYRITREDGDSAIVTLEAINNGAAADAGSITASVEGNPGVVLEAIESDIESHVFSPGSQIWTLSCQPKGGGAEVPMAEVYARPWEAGRRHRLSIRISGLSSGSAKILVRATLSRGDGTCPDHFNDPPAGRGSSKDQQGYDAFEIEVP